VSKSRLCQGPRGQGYIYLLGGCKWDKRLVTGVITRVDCHDKREELETWVADTLGGTNYGYVPGFQYNERRSE
jgi:hypothetical protein